VTVPEARVVNDPELRFAPSGVAVGRFRVVCNGIKKDGDGKWVSDDDHTLWLSVTCFRQLAENCAESLRKGDLVSVTGKLETDEWETEAGEKRSRTVLVADSVAASLKFRMIPHGAGRAERTSEPSSDDRWQSGGSSSGGEGSSEDPPF
jgi:single-strand DNA-binding protein